MKKCIVILITLLHIYTCISAQDKAFIDSLSRLVDTAVDTTRVNLLNQLGDAYLDQNNELSLEYSQKALAEARRIYFRRGMADAYGNMAWAYDSEGNYDKAVQHYESCIELNREIADKRATAWALNNLGEVHRLHGNYPLATKCYLESLKIREEIKYKKGMASSLNNLGMVHSAQEELKEALDYFEKALALKEEIGDKEAMVTTLNNIGEVYIKKGDYIRGANYALKALNIQEELGNKAGMTSSLMNIGAVYNMQKNLPKAIEYLTRALKIQEELQDKKGMAELNYNIAYVYGTNDRPVQALPYLLKALTLAREAGYKHVIKNSCEGLATTYASLGSYEKAYQYHLEYASMKDSLSNEESRKAITRLQANYQLEKKQGEITLLTKDKELLTKDKELQATIRNALIGVLGFIFAFAFVLFTANEQKKKINRLLTRQNLEINQQKEELSVQAIKLKQINEEVILKNDEIAHQRDELEKSYKNIFILSEIGQNITSILDVEEIIATVYDNVNNLMDATSFGIGIIQKPEQRLIFRKFIEQGKELPEHYEALEDPNSLSARCVKHKKDIFINDFSAQGGLYRDVAAALPMGEKPESAIFVPLLIENQPIGMITVQSFRKNAYTSRDIAMLRTLASYIAIALDNANAYHVIKNKNSQITDSIRYAQTIQHAILPSEKQMSEGLRDYFTIYRPKDIVSGDFYWFSRLNTSQGIKTFIAVVDCTGHGVPGAFMSMIGNTLFNKIINEKNIYNPAEVLEILNREVRAALRQDEKSNNDGMELGLCLLEESADDQVCLTYVGAKRPLYYVEQGQTELTTINGERRAIGGEQRKKEPFNNTRVVLSRNSILYLSTDGVSDQHNPAKEKFGSQRFKDLLTESCQLPMNEQKQKIEQALLDFQREAEQRDDITVIGIKV